MEFELKKLFLPSMKMGTANVEGKRSYLGRLTHLALQFELYQM